MEPVELHATGKTYLFITWVQAGLAEFRRQRPECFCGAALNGADGHRKFTAYLEQLAESQGGGR
jgi:hypothetical protein